MNILRRELIPETKLRQREQSVLIIQQSFCPKGVWCTLYLRELITRNVNSGIWNESIENDLKLYFILCLRYFTGKFIEISPKAGPHYGNNISNTRHKSTNWAIKDTCGSHFLRKPGHTSLCLCRPKPSKITHFCSEREIKFLSSGIKLKSF